MIPPAAAIPFRKMHGLGNDFVVIDARVTSYRFSPAMLARIADRRFGIGCDQLIVLEPSMKADAFMRIFNPDASEVGACGNATRCIGALLAQEKNVTEARIETQAGVLIATLNPDGMVTVDMGMPRLGWSEIPLSSGEKGAGTDTLQNTLQDTSRVPFPEAQALSHHLPDWFSAVNMGNPHAIFFVRDVDSLALDHLGPPLETDPIFPEKANISIVQQTGPQAFKVRVWERAAGITLACGTAACAVAVAAARLGLASGTITITLPGGSLNIARDAHGHVMMTGPVATGFTGVIDPSLLAGLA
jgi:diaminopimelate epimerase